MFASPSSQSQRAPRADSRVCTGSALTRAAMSLAEARWAQHHAAVPQKLQVAALLRPSESATKR